MRTSAAGRQNNSPVLSNKHVSEVNDQPQHRTDSVSTVISLSGGENGKQRRHETKKKTHHCLSEDFLLPGFFLVAMMARMEVTRV